MTTIKKPLVRAAEHAVENNLRLLHVHLVVCTIKVPLVASLDVQPETTKEKYTESLKKYFYVLLGQHHIAIVNSEMAEPVSKSVQKEVPGKSTVSEHHIIPYEDIREIRITHKAIDTESFCIYLKDTRSCTNVPGLVYFKCEARDEVLENLRIAYAACQMFHTLDYISPPLRIVNTMTAPKFKGADGEEDAAPINKTLKHDASLKQFYLHQFTFLATNTFRSIIPDSENNYQGIYGIFDKTGKKVQFNRNFFTVHLSALKPLANEVKTIKQVLLSTVSRICRGKEYRITSEAQSYTRSLNSKERRERFGIQMNDDGDWEILETHIRLIGWILKLDKSDVEILNQSHTLEPSMILQDMPAVLDVQDRYRDVTVAVARRRYLPPKRNQYQDIILCYRCDQRKWFTDKEVFSLIPSIDFPGEAIYASHDLMDSMASTDRYTIKDHERKVTTAQVEALLLSYDSFEWFRANLNLQPTYPEAKYFCGSILSFFFDHGFSVPDFTLSLNDRHRIGSDPMVYADRLGDMMPGMMPFNATPAHSRAWKCRVWEYLYYCVSLCVYFEELTLGRMVQHYVSYARKPLIQVIVGKILDHFVYLRLVRSEYQHTPLSDALRNPVYIFSKQLTFNVRALSDLLREGYIMYIMRAVDKSLCEYAQVLVRLLFWRPRVMSSLKNSHGDEFRHIICDLLYQLTPDMNPGKRDDAMDSQMDGNNALSHNQALDPLMYLDEVLPAMVSLLFDVHARPKLWAVKCLIKLTRDPKSFMLAKITTILASANAFVQIAELMKSREDSLCKVVCELIANLVEYGETRQRLVALSVIEYSFEILQWQPLSQPRFKGANYCPQPYRELDVLCKAMSILQNISKDSMLRSRIFDATGRLVEARRRLVILHGLVHSSNLKWLRETAGVVIATLRVSVLTVIYDASLHYSKNKIVMGESLLPFLEELLKSETSRDVLHICLKVLESLVMEPLVVKMLRGEEQCRGYVGLQKLMKGIKSSSKHRIDNFRVTLGKCKEIQEFWEICSRLEARLYG
jgi:hypothetical protein